MTSKCPFVLTLALPPVRLIPEVGVNFGRGFHVIVPLPTSSRAPLGTGAHTMVVEVGVTPKVVVVVELVVDDVDDVVDDDVVDDDVVVVDDVADVKGLEKCPVRNFVPPDVVQAAPWNGVMLPRTVTDPSAPKITMPCTLHFAVPDNVTPDGPW